MLHYASDCLIKVMIIIVIIIIIIIIIIIHNSMPYLTYKLI